MRRLLNQNRSSGVLLHITSLPSKFGIGDLGPESRKFAELLEKNNQHYWSILPLTSTSLEYGNSPYQSNSAFAGNPLIISPELLIEKGLLPIEIKKKYASKSKDKVDFQEVSQTKQKILKIAYKKFKLQPTQLNGKFCFEDFLSSNSFWLDDYALFIALRKILEKPWYEWPLALRDRKTDAINRKKIELVEEISFQKFIQYAFFSQWGELKAFCKDRGIRIVGDLPFYMAYDSADVWGNPNSFSLDRKKKLKFVGGVPPDYFSEDGQLWGNPVYNWLRIKREDFNWWIKRVEHSLKIYDLLRLDHFRGFVAYWRVKASAATAKKGKWIKAPSKEFFSILKNKFSNMPFIAEDLGVIDNEVKDAISFLGIPGMKVILFSFDGSAANPHLLKNHPKNAVVFTGTHDTNTVRGWFVDESCGKERANLYCQIGKKVSEETVSCELIKLALSSKADLSIIPLQDILSLDSEARMNHPSNPVGNWAWRVYEKQLDHEKFEALSKLTIDYDRTHF